MTDQDLLAVFTRVLRDLLADDSIVLTADTRRDDVPGWDSFAYVNFIVAVEMELGIKFGVADVESFENVGDIVRRAQSLLGIAAPEARAMLFNSYEFIFAFPAGHARGLLPAGRVSRHCAWLARCCLAVSTPGGGRSMS